MKPPELAALLGEVEAIAGDELSQPAREVLSKALRLAVIAAEKVAEGADVGEALVELGVTVATVALSAAVPAAGVVLAVASAIPWAAGIGPQAPERPDRQAWCRTQYAPARGSGPGLAVVPADIFVEGQSRTGDGRPIGSSLGRALRWLTEEESVSKVARAKRLQAAKLLALADATGGASGIDARRAATYEALRMAIESQHKRGDGGAALFVLYLDLLRADFEAKRLTPELARLLIAAKSFPMGSSVRDAGEETCLDNDPRPLQAVLDLVEGWALTVRPYYRAAPAVAESALPVLRAVDEDAAPTPAWAPPRARPRLPFWRRILRL